MPTAHDGAVKLGRVAKPIVLVGWGLLALAFVPLVFAGVDPASMILFALAIVFGGAAVFCVGRAIDAQGMRAKALWIGRALGLVGAAVAVSFPAVLYQEVGVVISKDDLHDLAWLPTAIWYEFLAMPLVLVPAFVALRWSRTGAVLFLLDGAYNIFLALFQPFGELYPDATASGFIGIPLLDLILQPGFIAAFFLLFGARAATPYARSGDSTLPHAAHP